MRNRPGSIVVAAAIMLAATAIGPQASADKPIGESGPAAISAPAEPMAGGSRSVVVAAAIAGLGFSPAEPLPGGAITVTGEGCDPGEDVLVRTFSTVLGDTEIDVVAAADAAGSFSIATRVWGAPGDPRGAAGGEQIGVGAYCGGVFTDDPDRAQVVFGTMATPVGGPVAPVAVPDSARTASGTPVDIDVLANDTGDGLRVVGGTNGAHGDVVWASDGQSMTYTPEPGFSGTDTFGYSIESSERLLAGSLVTVTVAAPAPPVAYDDAYATGIDTPLHVALPEGLLANDADPEGEPMRVCLATSTQPRHGTLTYPSNDGRFSYTPDPGFSGVDTFTYHAGDRTECGNHATVTITVGPAADAGAGGADPSNEDGQDRVLPDTGAPPWTEPLAVLCALLLVAGIWVLRRGRRAESRA